jgi:hypothetical protein
MKISKTDSTSREPRRKRATKPQDVTDVNLKALFDILREIQEISENLPCGGIGAEGPTQEELDAANEEGHPVEDDAVYHAGQQIWLLAERASKVSNGLLATIENSEVAFQQFITPRNLANALVETGIIHLHAIEDGEGYDNYRTWESVVQACSILNAQRDSQPEEKQ